MAYQYETSPRKYEPIREPRNRIEIEKRKEEKQKRELENKKQRKEALKQEKRKHHKNIAIIVGIFLLLLAISYRNSLITEKFNELQGKKQELSSIQKTNEQTQVSIESSLNLKNLEKAAEEKLGLQKLENDQKVYISLPKQDYTESESEEIIEEEENENWFQKIINNLFK